MVTTHTHWVHLDLMVINLNLQSLINRIHLFAIQFRFYWIVVFLCRSFFCFSMSMTIEYCFKYLFIIFNQRVTDKKTVENISLKLHFIQWWHYSIVFRNYSSFTIFSQDSNFTSGNSIIWFYIYTIHSYKTTVDVAILIFLWRMQSPSISYIPYMNIEVIRLVVMNLWISYLCHDTWNIMCVKLNMCVTLVTSMENLLIIYVLVR